MRRLAGSFERLVHNLNNRRMHIRFQVGASLALLTGLFLSTLLRSNLLGPFQARLSDFFYRPAPPSGQVAIVQIDDASLADVGPWPWGGGTLAYLLGEIADAHPRALVLTIPLSDPSGDYDDLSPVLQSVPAVYMPVAGVYTSRILPSERSFPVFDSALLPAPGLRTRNIHLGHDIVLADRDRIVRRVPIAMEAAQQKYTALGIVALTSSRAAEPDAPSSPGTGTLIRQLVEDGQGQMYINFAKWDGDSVLSAADIVHHRVAPARLDDKIVFVGAASSSASESYETPLTFDGKHVYPVEIQADLAETVLTNRLLQEQDGLTQITMIFLMALLAGGTLPHFRFLSAAGLTLLYFLAYLGYAFAKFSDGILVQPLYPALAFLLTFALTMTFRYFAEDRPRERVEQLFRRSVPAEVVEQALAVFDRDRLPLTGVRRQITLLHVDMHCFAVLTDVLSPESLLSTLNLYHARLVQIVFRHAGLVVKQTGDKFVAAWNLPLAQDDHAGRAVLAAIEIRQDLAKLSEERFKGLALEIGMGISTGNAVAGRIGGWYHHEYSIVGEVTTIAERFAANSDRTILVDTATCEQIGDEFQVREVKPMRIRGRAELVPAWQLLLPVGEEGQAAPPAAEER